MDDNNLYEMIFKRKSFHLFINTGKTLISDLEIKDIEEELNNLKPLVSDIKTKIIISKKSTNCKIGQEYCLLFYSEKKDKYLENIGFIGEQLDLFLVSKNIGTLWCGNSKPKESQLDDLDFVIMLAIKKVDQASKFRSDISKIKRKDPKEIWKGNKYLEIANIVRLAPSSLNSQPWFVDEKENELDIYRYRKESKFSLIPISKSIFYNKIDLGIFLFFLELTLNKNHLEFTRCLSIDEENSSSKILTAIYKLSRI